MRKIKVIIERANDGTYSAYGDKVDGIYGMGDTAEAAKKSALEGLRLLLKHSDPKHIPKALKEEHEIVFQFDTASLLNFYRGVFTNAALERITGINQRQLQHYSSGHRRPRITQAKKIQDALHRLGADLLAIQL